MAIALPQLADINFWLVFGFLGQGIFFCRFLVQWLASEKAKRTVVPMAFWYLSIGGGLMILIYAALHEAGPSGRPDWVICAGQAGGLVMYVRNIIIAARHKKSLATQGETSGPADGAAP